MATELTPIQSRMIEVSTHLFGEVVQDKKKTKEFHDKLTEYSLAHPKYGMHENIRLIFDRVLDQPIHGRTNEATDADIRVSLHSAFANGLGTAIRSDKQLVAMLQADNVKAGNHYEDVARATHVPDDMVKAAINVIKTSFNDDIVEALAVSNAVTTILHTGDKAAGFRALLDGNNPFIVQNQVDARLQKARDGVLTELQADRANNRITGFKEADIDSIMNAAQNIAKTRDPNKVTTAGR